MVISETIREAARSFDLCFAGFGQGLKNQLLSFLKIHMIQLFLTTIDQK